MFVKEDRQKEFRMFGLSVPELLICLVVVVLLFGTRRLPELGQGLGQAISNFRKSYRDGMTIDASEEKKQPEDKK